MATPRWIEDMVGDLVVDVRTSGHGSFLLIVIEGGGAHLFEAYGDCCAHAYVEAINAIAELPARITGWECRSSERGVGDWGNVMDVHFYELQTDRGVVQIELRVSHNGYYGGSLEYVGHKRAEELKP